MSKSLKDMNQKELYEEAKKLDIKGRSSLKKKEFRDQLIEKIIEARKQKVLESGEEQKVDEEGRTEVPVQREEEGKYDEGWFERREKAKRENRILEEALRELDDEKSREKMIEEALDEIEADKVQRRENQPIQPERKSQKFTNVLTPENINKLKSYFDDDKVEQVKNLYEETDKLITKHGVRDGVIRAGLKFLAPELNLMQQAADFLGLGYSDEDHKKLMDTILTGKSDRGSAEDMKLGFKLVFNPVEWGRLAYEEAFAIGDNVSTGVKDIIRKTRGIKKNVSDPEADKARGVVKERSDALKKKIAHEKKLAAIKGEEYSGLSEDDIVEDKLKMPKLSDYGGQDEKSALETVGETALELFGVPKRWFGDEDQVMKKRLQEKDPEAFRRYEEAMRKYETQKDRILETRSENIKGDAKRLKSDLASVIDSVLNEEKRNLQAGGKQRINDMDLEELHDMSLTLRDPESAISYDNLAEIYAGIKVNVPKNILNSNDVKTKMGAFDYLENTMLKPKTDTEADLRVSTNDKFQNTLEMKDRLDKEKKEIEDAIEEKRIDDERLEVIQSRADNITHGYVDTDNKGRPEYKMRVFYGNTDAQLMTTPEEKRTATLLHDTALMWPQLNTEDNSRRNTLWQKQQAWEKQRYSKTFQPPNPRDILGLDKDKKKRNGLNYDSKRKDKFNYRIPESFVRIGERQLIPVYPMTNVPDLRVPEQAQAPFNSPEPQNDFGSIKREQRVMANRFPERFLKNYNGPSIKPERKPLTFEENLRWIS